MPQSGLRYPAKLKVAKWFFAVAVALFVGKPFIGFAMDRTAPSNEVSILVKSFTKRKHEYVENSSYDAKTIQKKLAEPVNLMFLLFAGLLAIILPRLADALSGNEILFFRRLKLAPNPVPSLWLSNQQLLI